MTTKFDDEPSLDWEDDEGNELIAAMVESEINEYGTESSHINVIDTRKKYCMYPESLFLTLLF